MLCVVVIDSEGEEEVPQQVSVNNVASSFEQPQQEQVISQDTTNNSMYYTNEQAMDNRYNIMKHST